MEKVIVPVLVVNHYSSKEFEPITPFAANHQVGIEPDLNCYNQVIKAHVFQKLLVRLVVQVYPVDIFYP